MLARKLMNMWPCVLMFHFWSRLFFFHLLRCWHMWVQITFKYKTGNSTVRQRGVTIALTWLLASIRNFCGIPPPEDKTRQEIWNLDIGMICDQKRDKFANGKKISRAVSGVEIRSTSCVTVKHLAFEVESWNVFSEDIILLLT